MNKPSADRIIRTLVEILEARNNVMIKYAVKEVGKYGSKSEKPNNGGQAGHDGTAGGRVY